MATAAIVSLTELKAYLDITEDDQDVKLRLILDAMNVWTEQVFNDHGIALKKQTGRVELRDGKGLPHIFTRFRPIISVTSIHESRDQIFDAETLIPVDEYRVVNEQGLIRVTTEFNEFTFHEQRFFPNVGRFPVGIQNIQIIYDVGFEPIPADVKLGALTVMDNFFNRAGKGAFKSEKLGAYNYTLKDELTFKDEVIKVVLGPRLKQTFVAGI